MTLAGKMGRSYHERKRYGEDIGIRGEDIDFRGMEQGQRGRRVTDTTRRGEIEGMCVGRRKG